MNYIYELYIWNMYFEIYGEDFWVFSKNRKCYIYLFLIKIFRYLIL